MTAPIIADDLEQALILHRRELTGFCYRMLGAAAEAEDAVQETMLPAWRGLAQFDQRSSLRTWLYRISTRVCLDALAARSRRERPVEAGPQGKIDGPWSPPAHPLDRAYP